MVFNVFAFCVLCCLFLRLRCCYSFYSFNVRFVVSLLYIVGMLLLFLLLYFGFGCGTLGGLTIVVE